MLLVCDCNLWLEKDRDFVVMGQMTLFGRITGRDNRNLLFFEKSAFFCSIMLILRARAAMENTADEWRQPGPGNELLPEPK